jgi:hypothetical protein
MMLHQRPARDYETKVTTAESRLRWAGVANMLKRLTNAATRSWCDPAPDARA